MELDQAADVERVGLAEIGAHVVADLLEGIPISSISWRLSLASG